MNVAVEIDFVKILHFLKIYCIINSFDSSIGR